VIDRDNYIPVGSGHTNLRKAAILDAGGFRDMPAGEDIDLTHRLVGMGYVLVYLDDLVFHLHATTYGEYMRKYTRDVSVTLHMQSASHAAKRPNYIKFLVQNVIMPPIDCISGIFEDYDLAWLWHPVICWSKCFVIFKQIIKKQ